MRPPEPRTGAIRVRSGLRLWPGRLFSGSIYGAQGARNHKQLLWRSTGLWPASRGLSTATATASFSISVSGCQRSFRFNRFDKFVAHVQLFSSSALHSPSLPLSLPLFRIEFQLNLVGKALSSFAKSANNSSSIKL